MINISRRASCGRAEKKARGWGPRTLPPCFFSSRPWSKGGAPNRPPPFQAPLLPCPNTKPRYILYLLRCSSLFNFCCVVAIWTIAFLEKVTQAPFLAVRASVSAWVAKRFHASLVVLACRLLICCTIHLADRASVPALNTKRFHASLVVLGNRANKCRTWSIFWLLLVNLAIVFVLIYVK